MDPQKDKQDKGDYVVSPPNENIPVSHWTYFREYSKPVPENTSIPEIFNLMPETEYISQLLVFDYGDEAIPSASPPAEKKILERVTEENGESTRPSTDIAVAKSLVIPQNPRNSGSSYRDDER